MVKINFLVIIAFSILFVLIANAAEEGINESYNKTNEISNLSYSNDTAANNSYGLNNTNTEENQNKINEIAATSDALTLDISSDATESEEEGATAVTASFGVYLEIIG